MVHSENEVVSALAQQFEENMRIDDDHTTDSGQPEEVKKPVFVKRKDRETL